MTQDEIARERIQTSLDETLIVEAAAGTGKTSELVRRIAAILRTGRTTVDRIVAVTFTRKAAGELRIRLRVELDAARSTVANSEETENLENALKRLEEAHIGTIHSFCAEILRQRPVEARIPPGFQELDENQAALTYSRAFEKWIQDALKDMSPALRRALSRITAAPGTTDSGSPLEQLRSVGYRLVEWRDFPAPWRREPFNRDAEIDTLVPQILALAEMVAGCDIPGHPLKLHLQCVVDFVARIRRAEEFRGRDYDQLEGLLIRLATRLRNGNKGPKKFSAKHTRDDVLAAKDRLQSNLDNFERHSGADLASLLKDEVSSLVKTYEELKSRSGKLDFVDLLIRTRDLIRDNAQVRQFLQRQFTHILVDEFQDTDPVQAEILILLSADDTSISDWRAVRPAPGKLFLVGDPKQSIYRFRRADIIFYQDVCRLLQEKGANLVFLSKSFRAVRTIQEAVNASFAPEMTGNRSTGQPSYVPLEQHAGASDFPSVIVLPVPKPYGQRDLAKYAIEESLPSATAAFVQWLLRDSGWRVRDPGGGPEFVSIEPRHIALLFRRFMKYETDMTRKYVRALEDRDIPHLLWGARSFHEREEVETIRGALNAIEWPDDELSVYATLRGSLFAISDNLLLRYRLEVGSFHAFRALSEGPAGHPDFKPIVDTLSLLTELHNKRNRRAAVETIHAVLEASRAHAAFALRPSGNQVLMNVYRIADLARIYELEGGISFRGFVEQLNASAEREASIESPVLEESAEGVRIMTVHAAKGLEFPVVILADTTARIAQQHPDKYVDPARRLCAMRVLGCSPLELLDHEQEERARDEAEGVRVAYVAATRARDILIVPAIGDRPFDGWIAPLNKAIYPAKIYYRNSKPPQYCPEFGEATVLSRPTEYDGMREASVKPGLHQPEAGDHHVVWWDPAILDLTVQARFGLHLEEILFRDAPERAEESVRRYEHWKTTRASRTDIGGTPSLTVFTATDAPEPPAGYAERVEILRVSRSDITGGRPKGSRFGSLVHLILRDASFTATIESLAQLARTHGRLLGATEEEIESAAASVLAALQHSLLERVRQSSKVHRELPVVLNTGSSTFFEGVIDLVFFELGRWIVTDFKTDADDLHRRTRYRRQVGWYVYAMEQTTAQLASGCLLHV